MTTTPTQAQTPKGEEDSSIFAWELSPYKKPTSFVSRFFWGWRVWFEATFVFTLMEPWEKLFMVTIMGGFMLLIGTGIVKYLPYHLAFLYQRALYYLLGQEQADWASLQRAGTTLFGALGNVSGKGEL
ncbi:hypothetical protein DENSPDRAFT_787357 [Dentipellis sp. KUC8613]|nr:hypothetical protein DENSPDRAFT_787357 [Dentipellis sp. KUC8613]